MKYDFDVAVIGAGSGGLTVAFGLAGAGKKVALIEKGLIGGDCTNFGCIPSKALIDISKQNTLSPIGGKYPKGDRGVDLKSALVEVRARRQEIQDEESVDKVESKNLKVFQGFASFVDEHTLEIQEGTMQPPSPSKEREFKGEGVSISAKNIVIATGSSAMKLEIDGVDEKDILTNHEIFEQTGDIKNLVIIGGGYIGCELAESIATLGTQVYLVQRNNDLIPREEQESSDLMREIFESKGISVHTGMTAKHAKNGKLIITDSDGNNSEELVYDTILIALGRKINLDGLHLENAGVKYDKNGVIVNKFSKTNISHIFAIGDCVSGNPQFTHWANNEGRGVVRNIIVPVFKKSLRKMNLPAVLYTHNEIARVGKTKKELLKRYNESDIVSKKINFSQNDRSKVTNDTQGFILIHFKRVSGKVLGATIFGDHSGELIAQITLAMDNKISAYKIAKTIQAYPTKSDLIKRVADSFVVETLSNIKREISYGLHSNILQIITASIWLTVVIIFTWYKISSGQSFEEIALGFYNFISGNAWGPVIYVMAYAIRPIVLFPATLMTFMSGALFGLPLGMLFTLVGETLSACFAYFLGRVFGKKLLDEEGGGIIAGLKNKVNSEPFMSVLMTRFLFFPFDLTNYACGFLKVKFSSYVLATALGIIPGMTVFILAGSAFHNTQLTSFSDALKNVDTKYLLYAAALFVITIVFAKILRKIKK